MNVPLSLVRKLVDGPVSAQDLAELMNGRIAEVEHVIRFPARSAVADVRVGVFEELVAEQEGVQQWRVVAGESELLLAVQVRHDFEAGGRYAVVPAGGHTPGGDPVDARPMGPFDSQGMVLSEATLGIGDDATRPFAFAPEVPPDADVFEVLELDDAVLVFDLEPNRPDLFSLVGMARDLSAIFDTELRLPDSVSADWDPVPPDELRIDIQATERVHRYAALELSGVRVGPSPQWLQNAVRKLGMRPINNVVDAAHLAMLELGQPLHTFDRHSLSTGVLGLRLARPGEPLTPLDGIGLVLLFGGVSLLLGDDTLYKMKPTVLYSLFAVALLVARAFNRLLLKGVLEDMWKLTEEGWRKLTMQFALFFFVMAGLNELAWRVVGEDFWVAFKVFGGVGLMILFTLSRVPFAKRHALEPSGES